MFKSGLIWGSAWALLGIIVHKQAFAADSARQAVAASAQADITWTLAIVGISLMLLTFTLLSLRQNRIINNKLAYANKELEETNRELHYANARLRSHITRMPLAYLELDREMRIIDWNPEAELIFGFCRSEIMGKRAVGTIVPGEWSKPLEGIWQALLSRKGGYHHTNGNITKYGKNITCEWTNTPILDDTGKVQSVACIAQDVTDREAHRETIEKALDEATAATEAKSRFLANVSHEIRTPMNGVMGMAQLLMNSPLNEEQQDNVHAIQYSCQTLLGLINDILDISKIEAHRMALAVEPLSMERLAERLEQTIKPLTREKDLALSVQIEEDAKGIFVVDPMRLRQVLVNLLGNAVKFTDQGRVQLRIFTTRDQDDVGDLLCFAVSDTGIGIDAETQEQLFKPFFQHDDSRARNYQGSGLGLTISSSLATLMGGGIGVHSTPGQGSTFTLSIPAVPSDEISIEEMDTAIEVCGVCKIGPLKVLLCEDNMINQRVAQSMLETAGHQVTLAHNGEEGLQAVEDHDFDVVLMDLQMPVMDGLEATKWIRTRPDEKAGLPIIAVTADAVPEVRQTCLETGMNAFLNKPYQKADLLNVVCRHACSLRVAPLEHPAEAAPAKV